ncbi:MAG: hypothetical protein JO013_04355 [Alphaproteobacteria bacterium]|nr:hypothetical protein [Alphaproteobacteria bacterium]
MDEAKLEMRLVAAWREAAADLGIAVTAPVEVRDAAGEPFRCEVWVRDFGSPGGGLVVSARTERRVRRQLRGSGLSYCLEPTRARRGYDRHAFIAALIDWGWFGPPDARPGWWPAGRE